MKVVINDGGRAAAGFKGAMGDCVARSIAIVSGRPYREVYDALARIMAKMPKTKRRKHAGIRSASNGVYARSKLVKDYMKRLGFVWTPTMRIGSGCKVHLTDGELPKGRLVVVVSRHYTAVIDGVIHDVYDPQRATIVLEPGKSLRMVHRCVYGYFTYP